MKKIEPRSRAVKISFIFISLLVLAATFSAGLWPFAFSKKNDVMWKPALDGLYFGETGMAISDGAFSAWPSSGSTDCTIELWIEPAASWDSSTILSFYEPGVAPPRVQIRQSGDDLVFGSTAGSKQAKKEQNRVSVDHVLHQHERVLITLTSSNETLSIYVNGVRKQNTERVRMYAADFRGTLVLANVQKGNFSWTGIFRGLAFYDRALGPAEVNENYGLWQVDRAAIARKSAAAKSLYLFNEQQGETVHNVGRAGPDIIIPKTYFIFEPKFLVPFWQEYRPTFDYMRDIAINIFGLVPAGFCIAGLLAWIKGTRRCLFYATLLGFCLSLTIEILQAFIPTRFSGTTDLITNSLGAGVGAWLYLRAIRQGWWKRLGFVQIVEAQKNFETKPTAPSRT